MEQFWQIVAYVESLERENAALRQETRFLTKEVEGLRELQDTVIKNSLSWKGIEDWIEVGKMVAESEASTPS